MGNRTIFIGSLVLTGVFVAGSLVGYNKIDNIQKEADTLRANNPEVAELIDLEAKMDSPVSSLSLHDSLSMVDSRQDNQLMEDFRIYNEINTPENREVKKALRNYFREAGTYFLATQMPIGFAILSLGAACYSGGNIISDRRRRRDLIRSEERSLREGR
ncbi:MAG: hypothetical protein IIA87_04075 [Nanoarchaeota archaeon]|nr:hypothetical protein [Nanoarchaeota archaeon]